MAAQRQPTRAELVAQLEELHKLEEGVQATRQLMADIKAGKKVDMRAYCELMGVELPEGYLDDEEDED